jgi:GT2 family glycosyltransferase
MKVSVVIPSYNSGQELRACLLTLNHQDLGRDHEFEVVVVDDGSDDGTESLIGQLEWDFKLEYRYLPRTAGSGRSSARNHGIRAATGDLVILVDADVLLPPGLLAAHLDYHLRRPDMVVIGPRTDLVGGEIDLDRLARSFSLDALPPVKCHDDRDVVFASLSDNLDNLATCWHYMFSCNFSVRREHLMAVGGFDETFTGWGLEDSELGYRLRRHGLAFAYNRDALVLHQHPQVWSGEKYQDWRANLTRFTTKYATDPDVTAQWVFDRTFDPATSDITWEECCRRFELAVRALHGRLPDQTTYELVEVDEHNRAEVLLTLPERARSADLLVIDRVGDSALAAAVQCTRSPRELVYFSRPSAETRAEILATYPLTPMAGDVLCRR